jgi:hypothetical protein
VAGDAEWREKLRLVAQDHVAEPVLAAGVFAPAGAAGGMGVAKISPLAGMFEDRKINERAGGLGHRIRLTRPEHGEPTRSH